MLSLMLGQNLRGLILIFTCDEATSTIYVKFDLICYRASQHSLLEDMKVLKRSPEFDIESQDLSNNI